MNRRVIVSLLIILMSLTAIGGSTLAWFTASTDPIENVFTAGTVAIKADEEVITDEVNIENWNPGDCVEKQFTITNTGTKGIKLRGKLTYAWYQKDSSGNWVPWQPTVNPVTVTVVDANSGWTQGEDGNWYYDERIPGTYEGADEEARTVTLTLKVCLDGAKAGNEFQGKQFRLSVQFQAIQASHSAEDGEEGGWTWDQFDNYN